MSEHTPLTEAERDSLDVMGMFPTSQGFARPAEWERETEARLVRRIERILAARTSTATADTARLRDLTRRLGFGDNITEPMADNDTIIAFMEQQARDADEWRESQRWRDDCYAKGHPDDEDCRECDPSLWVIRAEEAATADTEAAQAEAHNLAADLDRCEERLWRLAAKAGWRPGNPADNNATAEAYIADALEAATADTGLRERVAEIVARIEDDPRYDDSFGAAGLFNLRDDLRDALDATPASAEDRADNEGTR